MTAVVGTGGSGGGGGSLHQVSKNVNIPTIAATDNKLSGTNCEIYPMHVPLLKVPLLKVPLLKVRLHDAIYRQRFYSNLLIHISSLSNLHNNVVSILNNCGDKSHRLIVALPKTYLFPHLLTDLLQM